MRLRSIYVLLCLGIVCVTLFPPVFVTEIAAQTPVVVGVEIEGNVLVEFDSIRYLIESEEGKPLNIMVVREDIKRLFDSGSFTDIRVEYEPAEGGVVLKYIVTEKPMVVEIKFTGDKGKVEELKELVSIKERKLLNLSQVKDDVNSIRKFYSEKAFNLAEITYDLEQVGRNQVVVNYIIDKHEKVEVKRINFIGNDHFSNDELKKILLQKEKGFFQGGKFKEEQVEIDQQILTNFYFDHGYITAIVGRPNIYLTPDKTFVYITYIITEGLQYKMGKLTVNGDLINPEEIYIKDFRLREGEIFNRSIFVNEVNRLTERYMNLGYAYATVIPRTQVHEEEQTVDVNLFITKGELARIDEIVITGNSVTRDRVIRRDLTMAEGDLFSNLEIMKSKMKLSYLSFFENTEIIRLDRADRSHIGLEVKVEEKQTGALSFGAGYSSVDEFFVIGQFSQLNLLGRGQRLKFSAQFSRDSQYFTLGFTEPRFRDTRLSLGGDLYNREVEYSEYTKKVSGGDVFARYPIWRNLYHSVTYNLYETTISDVDDDASTIILDQEGTALTSAIGTRLEWDTRNNYLEPTRGNRQSIGFEYGGGILGGDNYYTEYIASSSWYFPMFWNTVFSLRGQIGYITPHGGRDLPIYMLYRLGGLYSVRGFESATLGPRDPETDDVIGGNKKLVFNTEYMFPIFKPMGIKGVLFFDAGNSFGEDDPYDLGDLRYGAGYGVRWFSPIGPLRFEWGYNLDPKDDERAMVFEFNIGAYY